MYDVQTLQQSFHFFLSKFIINISVPVVVLVGTGGSSPINCNEGDVAGLLNIGLQPADDS